MMLQDYILVFHHHLFFDIRTAVLSPANDRLQPALFIIGSGSLKKFLLPRSENFLR